LIRLLLVVLALACQAPASYASLTHSPVPGGIALIPLPGEQDTAPLAFFNDRRVMVLKLKHTWTAVVGLPLDLSPGPHQLMVRTGRFAERAVEFTVRSRKYPEQHLKIGNKRFVTPSARDLRRIKGERSSITQALQYWTENPGLNLELIKPVQGRISSRFGLRRFFNDQPRKPHSGVDIAAARGTPILAPAAGKVLQTGEFFFNGKTVFVDHGQGMVSMFCHLDSILVKPGTELAQGDIFGKVGRSGRVTGPHLHWSLSLNDALIDPLLFFSEDRQHAQRRAQTRVVND
jgi:murein DD-endopeptidase MepM/ murein hydrolase activator NlpD